VSEAHVETVESREIKDDWILMQRSQIYLEDLHYKWDVSNHIYGMSVTTCHFYLTIRTLQV